MGLAGMDGAYDVKRTLKVALDESTPRPASLLDQAQQARQHLVQAQGTLQEIFNTADVPQEDRGIDQPHRSLTQEMELLTMQAGALALSLAELQRRIGAL